MLLLLHKPEKADGTFRALPCYEQSRLNLKFKRGEVEGNEKKSHGSLDIAILANL